MRRLAGGLAVVSALSVQLSGQERDRSLERIALALQRPSPDRRGVDRQTLGVSTVEPTPEASRLGPFTLGTPQLQGEIIRLSLPIGEYVARGARGLAAANRRRQETAARRRVEADLRAFAARQPPKE